MWPPLQVLVAMVTDAAQHDNTYRVPSVINVGLLQPLEGPLGFERTGSAASMAVRDAQSRGYLNRTDVKYSSIHCFIFFSCLSPETSAFPNYRVGPKSKPAYFCILLCQFVYCQPIFIIFGTQTLEKICNRGIYS